VALELGQDVTPVLLLGQRRRGHRTGDVLDQAAGDRPAVVVLQVDLGTGGTELGVLVGEDLGEAGVDVTTIRASRSSGQLVGPPSGL